MRSPWEFKITAQSGMPVSESVSARRRAAPTIYAWCVRWSAMDVAHGGAMLQLHTGSNTFTRPEHGLVGHLRTRQREPESARLHDHQADAVRTAARRTGVRRSCPRAYQGTPIGNAGMNVERIKTEPIEHLANTLDAGRSSDMSSTCCRSMNRRHAGRDGVTIRNSKRAFKAFELAFRMQTRSARSARYREANRRRRKNSMVWTTEVRATSAGSV